MCVQTTSVAQSTSSSRSDPSAHRSSRLAPPESARRSIPRREQSYEIHYERRPSACAGEPKDTRRGEFDVLPPATPSHPFSQTLEILAREESEDTAFRSQYGTDRWTRQPSRSANSHLRERADNLGAIIAAAGKSDALVRAKFGEHELQIGILGSSEVRPRLLLIEIRTDGGRVEYTGACDS